MPEDPYEIPIGKALVGREGSDVTLLGIGRTTSVCHEAAEELDTRGYSAEVVDLLSLSPLDFAVKAHYFQRPNRQRGNCLSKPERRHSGCELNLHQIQQ